ncbi:dapper homolog 1 [Pseudoliparis swirei]|uniref:dapper homolog 1 n=1 Tax=Pseudoliparis swirei TaxID=2059687 RepID=UPI0024BD9A97|nr:dapper homolog 1 [Pseudoliparis swirei]
MSRRDQLEATVSGLGELEYLRQRQEVLVRTALELREEEKKEEKDENEEKEEKEEKEQEPWSSVENILLFRKQLNCLRRTDAGLTSQLQDLDRQISDLRLDSEASHDQQETDSRPSSGFYECSDGVSLSNSSNSVFSECFSSTAEADGRLLSAVAVCLDCAGLVGGLCEDPSVRRSLSAPHPASLDPASSVDSQSKYHCNLIARNGSEVYRYPSPLHAVAVQSPVSLQMEGPGDPRGPGRDVAVEELIPEPSPLPASDSDPPVCQSSSWLTSSSQAPSYRRLDSYICSLLQRRALPFRTSRPRTSISADPSMNILKQANLCVRQLSGSGLRTLRKFEFKPCGPTGGASAGGAAPLSPQWSVDSKSEENQNVFPDNSIDSMHNIFRINNKDSAQHQNISLSGVGLQRYSSVTNQDIGTSSKTLPPPSAVSDLRGPGGPKANSSPKETKEPYYSLDQDRLLKSPAITKTSAPKNSPKPPQTFQKEKVDRSVLEVAGSSSQSQKEAGGGGGGGGRSHMVNTKSIPAQQHTFKLRKTSKNVKTVKMKTIMTMRTSRGSEHNEPPSERRGDKSHQRSGSKKSRLLNDGGSVSTKASGTPVACTSWINCPSASILESRVLDQQATSTSSSVQSGASRHHLHGHHHHGHHHHGHHHHRREQVSVVAKLKYKRNDYRRLGVIVEVPNNESFRRAQKKELSIHSAAGVPPPSPEQVSSPYSYVAGSDSEYSAECASLFHSTIADSSEDERSNCTTNRFGDSESGEVEYVKESSTGDTEESGGGGACCGTGGMGQRRSQSGAAGARAAGKEMTPAQSKAFVKIKASHHLKKKILRFRTGSLKLMTTV